MTNNFMTNLGNSFAQGIPGAIAGIGSFIGNQVSSAINSKRAWKYAQKAMYLQDKYNRKFTKDYYSLNRESLESADYNPLLALPGSTANGASYSPNMMNADSDIGDQAVNSAMSALTNKANINNINKQTEKTKEETEKTKEEKEGIELDNRLKRKQLNTDPKAIISDLAEGENTPVTDLLQKVGTKLGLPTSAISTPKQTAKVIKINLAGNKPYVQKGVPRSVVKSFEGKNSAVSQQKGPKFTVLTDKQVNNYSKRRVHRNYNRPPKGQLY